MFGRQSQAQITDTDKRQDDARGHDLPPRFPENENRDQKNRKDEAAFFAERAQEKKNRGGEVEQPAIGARDGRRSNPAVKPEKSEHRGQRIGPAGNVSHGRGMYGMNCPDQRGQERDPAAKAFLNLPAAQQLNGKEKKGERRADMAKDAGEVITGRLENERRVVSQVSEPLDRPIEIGRRRVDKKKMLKGFRNELPAPDERVAEDECGIVPDEIVSQRRRVGGEKNESKKNGRDEFFQRRRFGWTEAIRCASRFGKC